MSRKTQQGAPPDSDSEFALCRTAGGAARATLNRPESANALHGPALAALARAVRAAGEDDNARALVLDGAGRHFCAGADINWMLDSQDDSRNIAATRALAELLLSIRRLPKPVVVFAHGACAGGGAGLCAAADIAAADESAVFSFREVKLGIVPAVISPYVVERIGAAKARRLFITGERVGAKEAAAMGLVDYVADTKRFPNPRDIVEDILEGLRECGPGAMAAAKRLTGDAGLRAIGDSTAKATADILAQIRTTDEAREGLSAFLEKRRPKWAARGNGEGGGGEN